MSPDRYKYFQECTRAPFCPVSTRNIDQLAVVEGSLCQALSNLWPSPLMVMYRAEKKLLLDNGITSCVTIFCRMIGLGQVIILHTNIANKLNTPRRLLETSNHHLLSRVKYGAQQSLQTFFPLLFSYTK